MKIYPNHFAGLKFAAVKISVGKVAIRQVAGLKADIPTVDFFEIAVAELTVFKKGLPEGQPRKVDLHQG
jgi:hypothetical protein